MRWFGRRVAECFRAFVDQLLGNAYFLVRGGQLIPAFLNHVLGLLELRQRVPADVSILFHKGIIPGTGGQGHNATWFRSRYQGFQAVSNALAL